MASRYMSEQDMLSIASKFSPYRCVYLRSVKRVCAHRAPYALPRYTADLCRSLFMWYMWRIADVDTEVLE